MSRFTRELRAGLVDPDEDDAPACIECGHQSCLHLLDDNDAMWLTCDAHTGSVAVRLLNGELDDATPSLLP